MVTPRATAREADTDTLRLATDTVIHLLATVLLAAAAELTEAATAADTDTARTHRFTDRARAHTLQRL